MDKGHGRAEPGPHGPGRLAERRSPQGVIRTARQARLRNPSFALCCQAYYSRLGILARGCSDEAHGAVLQDRQRRYRRGHHRPRLRQPVRLPDRQGLQDRGIRRDTARGRHRRQVQDRGVRVHTVRRHDRGRGLRRAACVLHERQGAQGRRRLGGHSDHRQERRVDRRELHDSVRCDHRRERTRGRGLGRHEGRARRTPSSPGTPRSRSRGNHDR